MLKKSSRPFKRVMAATLSVAMMATMLAPFTTLAIDSNDWDSANYPAGYVNINVSTNKTEVKPGDTLQVIYDLNGDATKAGSDFLGCTLYYCYDSTQLKYDGSTLGWGLGDVVAQDDDTDLDSDSKTDKDILLSMTNPDGVTPLPLPPYAGSSMVTLNFTVLDSAAADNLHGTTTWNSNGEDTMDMNYEAAQSDIQDTTNQTKIVVAPTKITLDQNTLDLAVGGSATLNATVEPASVTSDVEWSSEDPDVASVTPIGSPSRSATVTPGNKAGTTNITAKIGDLTATCQVNVTVPLTGITVSADTTSILKNQTANLTAAYVPAEPTNKPNIKWSSDADDIASVEAVGNLGAVVTGKKTGTAEITATAEGTNFSDSVTITVSEKQITSISLNKHTTTINKGNTETLVAKIDPDDTTDDKTITWKSDNDKIASVDANGVVTANGVGTVDITASVQSGDGSTKSDTCAVTVNNPLTNITLDKSDITLTPDKNSDNLQVSFDPADASQLTNVVWTVDDADVVSITASGTNNSIATITAGTKYGDAVVTATETTVDGIVKTATCTVHNTNPLKGISLDKTDIELTKTETAQLTVIYNPNDTTDDKTVTWTSSDPSIVEVANGLVSPVKGGRAVITAKVGNFTATCNVFVNVPVEKSSFSDDTVKAASSLPVGDSLQMKIVYEPYDASNIASIVWTTSNKNVADVDGNGVVTAKSTGTATITAKIVTLDGKEFIIEQNVNVTEAQNGGGVVPSPENNGGATVTPSASNAATPSSTNNVKTGDAFPLAGIAALAALSAAGAVLIKRRKK